MTRPDFGIGQMRSHLPNLDNFLSAWDEDTVLCAETEMKYAGYIEKRTEK